VYQWYVRLPLVEGRIFSGTNGGTEELLDRVRGLSPELGHVRTRASVK